jgi:hypothetical protein
VSKQAAIAEVSSGRFACRANEVSCFMIRPQPVEGLLVAEYSASPMAALPEEFRQ